MTDQNYLEEARGLNQAVATLCPLREILILKNRKYISPCFWMARADLC
jgi:hypothetical protein